MAFDDWFVMNYARLKESIGLMSVFDDDAFHEAYLTIVTSKSLPATASGYRKIFLTTYRQISRHNLNESYTISHPDDLSLPYSLIRLRKKNLKKTAPVL